MRNESIDTPVLVVGAGAAGCALALELGQFGVPCIVIEKGDGHVAHPKTGHISVRTMEYCRHWGFEDEVNKTGFPQDYPLDTVLCTGLFGYEIARSHGPSLGATPELPVSPSKRTRVPQMWFDPLLARKAQQLDTVDIRYGHELISFEDAGDHVVATIQEVATGKTLEVTASYLVGADGATSTVRSALGYEMLGERVLNYSVNIIWRCPELTTMHKLGPAERYIVFLDEGLLGNVTVVDGKELWRLTVYGNDAHFDLESFDARAQIIRALGRDDVDFEVDSVLTWRRSELVAEKYGRGRVWLAGDAVHTMSPTGGFGMNTALEDSVNLAWKLAAKVRGWGGDELLPSYETERRAIGLRNVAAAAQNYWDWTKSADTREITQDTPRGATSRGEIAETHKHVADRIQGSLGIILGVNYHGSPVVVDPSNGPSEIQDSYERYVPSVAPGVRAPHQWLDSEREKSSLDLFCASFTLIYNQARELESEMFAKAFSDFGAPLKSYSRESLGLEELYDRDFVLVRPDGYVAYSSNAELAADGVQQIVAQAIGLGGADNATY